MVEPVSFAADAACQNTWKLHSFVLMRQAGLVRQPSGSVKIACFRSMKQMPVVKVCRQTTCRNTGFSRYPMIRISQITEQGENRQRSNLSYGVLQQSLRWITAEMNGSQHRVSCQEMRLPHFGKKFSAKRQNQSTGKEQGKRTVYGKIRKSHKRKANLKIQRRRKDLPRDRCVFQSGVPMQM